jgi:hypothetical protein
VGSVTGGPGHVGVVVGERTEAFFAVVVEAELAECELLHAAAMHAIPTMMTRMNP